MDVRQKLLEGLAIPAHPLALTSGRKLDERRQRALTRYYLAAGAGGLAVGVHTTQFAIRDPRIGLYAPVLELAIDELRRRPEVVRIAGIVGPARQAVAEAELAAGLGYHAGLLSLGALKTASVPELLDHARAVAAVIPVVGFYLQPSVGGRVLPFEFWRDFARIENVVAIKIAPFNRYRTVDVVRAVALSGRAAEIALYTGNDDNIVGDLVADFDFDGGRLHVVGGLLGHWAVWTRCAVALLGRIHRWRSEGGPVPRDLLALGAQITDMNAALFDAANDFSGCIAGIQEVLARQGLLAGRWTLDPAEDLSPGQAEEIDRVGRAYPGLRDDGFIKEHLDEWLS
jgi:dihydrodipicolinate synthase/N-acetylneuraminate lyase